MDVIGDSSHNMTNFLFTYAGGDSVAALSGYDDVLTVVLLLRFLTFLTLMLWLDKTYSAKMNPGLHHEKFFFNLRIGEQLLFLFLNLVLDNLSGNHIRSLDASAILA